MKNLKLKRLLALMTVTFLAGVAMLPIKASAAWKQDSTGWWNTEASSYSTGWKTIDGTWYNFGTDGYMKTGWFNDGGKWYHSTPSGAMQTGWLSDNNVWYCLDASGAMKTGLVELNNKIYYLSESGAMQTGNITINGINYTFAANGEKVVSANANPTTSTPSATDTTATDTSVSSGGGGGGTSSTSASTPYYKSLYGTWTVGDHIPSTMETTLSDTYIALAPGQEFKIESNKISSLLGDISDPSIKEGTLTSSEFSNKYKDTLDNLGISGDTVKYIRITDPNKTSHSVTIFIAPDEKTYILVSGSLFELEK